MTMGLNIKTLVCNCGRHMYFSRFHMSTFQRFYHKVPFLDLYEKTTGQRISKNYLPVLKKKHPHIDTLSEDRLQYTLQILKKFNIDAVEACQSLHIFSMNPITMDNYGEILKECGFVKIIPMHIIRYHTIVKSRTMAFLKKEGLIREDFKLEKSLQDKLQEWPESCKTLENFNDSDTSILTIRMNVLEKYLKWRLSVTSEEFHKYCRNYLPFRHKPMSDIKEAIDIAQNDIKFDKEVINRNGFIICSDPINTKLIIENVSVIAGLDIREVIRIEPAMLKNNYNAILQIRDILEEYRIPEDAQRRCLKVYCMCPKTVRERLKDLLNLKEYQVLSTNPRVLTLVIHKNKMMNRLLKIQAAKKQCYSLNSLVSSTKVFDSYISKFGNKICSRDLAILITSSLQTNKDFNNDLKVTKEIINQLKRHKYCLHTALNVIDQNIKFLKEKFNDEIILDNCHLLLYPVLEVKRHINLLLEIRNSVAPYERNLHGDVYFDNLHHKSFTDRQILSLVLYEIEKKYHFSGDGIWTRQDGVKVEAQSV